MGTSNAAWKATPMRLPTPRPGKTSRAWPEAQGVGSLSAGAPEEPNPKGPPPTSLDRKQQFSLL